MKPARSHAVCILGMHRSGTSVLCQAIHRLLNISIGNPKKLFLRPHHTNITGHWEHLGIVNTHDQILRTFGRTWSTNQPLPPNWVNDPRMQPYKQQLRKIIQHDLAIAPIWMWKDPRMCLLLPLWKQLLREKNIPVRFLIIVRNPLDVAASLQKRDGISLQKSLLIWHWYTLNALLHSAGHPRILVNYEHLLSHPLLTLLKTAQGLSLPKPNRIHLRRTIPQIIQPSLCHSITNPSTLQKKTRNINISSLYQLCLAAEKSPQLLHRPIFIKNIYGIISKMK